MKKRVSPKLSVINLIEEDSYNIDRPSSLIIPDLVAAIKELLKRVSDLEDEVANKIDKLHIQRGSTYRG